MSPLLHLSNSNESHVDKTDQFHFKRIPGFAITSSQETRQSLPNNKPSPLGHRQTHTFVMLPLIQAPSFGKLQVWAVAEPVFSRGLKTHTRGFVCLLWQQPIMTRLSGTIGLGLSGKKTGSREVREQKRKYFPSRFRVWHIFDNHTFQYITKKTGDKLPQLARNSGLARIQQPSPLSAKMSSL